VRVRDAGNPRIALLVAGGATAREMIARVEKLIQ
jgi:hypothetical protein